MKLTQDGYSLDRFHRVLSTLAAILLALAVMLGASVASAQGHEVEVISDDEGMVLQVDGEKFMVFGMNWGYMPIGQNYTYSLWTQPEEVIISALEREMPLLKGMGVNVIRQYVGITPRWVTYIYERWGIYTVLNHAMARYGFTLDGVWIPSVDYSDPRLREAVKAEILGIADEFQNVPGMLFWLLGNENNYGLSWNSNEIQALPEGERNAARARHLYSLFEEVARGIKEQDSERLVALCNGDVQYIDIIAEECNSIDIFGTNVYRGISARDLFQVVKDKLDLPVMFTEFGADAFNAKFMREDQSTQARYLLGQWQEIYEQSSGKGRVGNAIGGLIFQWSDGWWKYKQEERLDIHDTNASWPNGGYAEDFVEGENNMNEEWWGITAKGRPDHQGLYEVFPRAAYFGLRDAFRLEPYAAGTDIEAIRRHFGAIDPVMMEMEARGNMASLKSGENELVRLSGLRLEFETFSTGGSNISTPPAEEPQEALPSFRGFDHLQSFFLDTQVQPAPNVLGTLSLNFLGHVPLNPIDEIFYENRGRQRTLVEDDGDLVRLDGIERVKVYQASAYWDDKWFNLEGFYRTGHYHWGHEGDMFGIFREAYYGENIDIYNAEAPVGGVLTAKKTFEGLKVAFGPELHWGANPAIILKYRRQFGSVTATAMYQDEFAEQTTVTTSSVIPVPPTRRATLSLDSNLGQLGITVGGIWGGSTKVDSTFQIAEETDTGYELFEDTVKNADTFGGRIKLTLESGRWHWYGQAGYAGIVADGGPDPTITYTGWSLKETGLGNGTVLLTGLAVNTGNFQIGPNVLWQKPVVGPIPGFLPSPARPRDIRTDPFSVRANRETTAGELLITYDPTPATWFWAWDNIVREDASLAWSLGFVYRHLPTTQDASLFFSQEGDVFAFRGAPPPEDLWEVKARIVSRLRADMRLVANLFAGRAQPNGWNYNPDSFNEVLNRTIYRYGGDARLTWGKAAFATHLKIDDWGPYDYHKDFNLTFPLQLMGDVSHSLGMPRWFGYPQTRVGLRGTWRSLDTFSNRYCPEGSGDCDRFAPGDNGSEWEIRTYIHISI